MDSVAEYSFASRLLHRLALQNIAVAQMSFTLEQVLCRDVYKNSQAVKKPVFVTGLARSGSTLLTRILYESGSFCSLTYRNMPFVLMPNFWRRISGISHKKAVAMERAHQDGVQVDYDSPEAFDEVFWRVFAGDEYIAKHCLRPHTPEPHIIEQFKAYIGGIIGNNSKGRYLSKNNNNILRLQALHQAFPDATILIPFRDPLQQALSLQRQHQRFMEMSKQDMFVTHYMDWLGHYEFGPHQKQVTYADALPFPKERGHVDYWLTQWINVYEHVLGSLPASGLFICFDRLCATPQASLTKLFEAVDVPPPSAETYKAIRPTKKLAASGIISSELLGKAQSIYGRMVDYNPLS